MISKFDTQDNKQVALYLWDKVENPKLILQIVHGMCEHSARYDDFAAFLNSKGIIVAMNDLRGHGKSCPAESWGYDDGDMWENNISDQTNLSAMLSEKYKLPLVLMGHSYGSFLTQRLLEVDRIPEAYVLSGSCYMKNLLTFFGAIIAGNMAKKDPKAPGTTMADMSFKSYEKKIPGLNAWLNRDPKEVDKYNVDPACGYVASNSFYASFMKGLKTIYSKENVADIDIDKPVYIFSGSNDPVGEYGKGVVKLYDWLKKVGVRDLSMKLYEGGRHEMLNELNKAEVYADVYAFLQRFMEK